MSIFKPGSTTEFKDLVDYFGEIHDIWDEMTQKQQNDFLDKAFGKNQAQAGAAIIQNYDAVRKALKEMENDTDSADREMATVQESITFKLNNLKETWTDTWKNLIDRGDLGKIVDAFTKISEGLGWIIDKLGVLGSLGAGAGIFASLKGAGRRKMQPSHFEYACNGNSSYTKYKFPLSSFV